MLLKTANSLLLVSTLFLVACATAPRQDYKPPSTVKVRQSINQGGEKVTRAKELAKQVKEQIVVAEKLAPDIPELRLALIDAGKKVDTLTQELINSEVDRLQALASLDFVDKGNQKLAKTANTLQDRAEKAETKKDVAETKEAIAVHKYHELKLIVCSALAGITALLMYQFRWILLPLGWLGIGVMLGLPAAVFTFFFFRL